MIPNKLDWLWSGSRTFRTQFEPDFEPGVQESGLAEYPNPNLLAGLGSSSNQTQTSGSNLKPQPHNVVLLQLQEIDEPTHTTKVAVPSSQITSMTTTITTQPSLTLTTTRRTRNLRTVGLE